MSLINRDRANFGLAPLVLDEIATRAADRHLADMIANGFTAHWGTDGSVPELRYTEEGGADLVVENVACFGDAKPHSISTDGPYDPADIERAEARFFDEQPPKDGHRKNILLPLHNRVGIAFGRGVGNRLLCAVQELVHHLGTYAPLPRTVAANAVVHIEGELAAPFTFGAVGIAWLDMPKPMKPNALVATGSYVMPEPHVLFQTDEFETPRPVVVAGRRFAIDVPFDALTMNGKKRGLYEVVVYAKAPDAGARVDPVSARVIRVD